MTTVGEWSLCWLGWGYSRFTVTVDHGKAFEMLDTSATVAPDCLQAHQGCWQ